MKYYGRDRGSSIMGTEGRVIVDRDGYEVFDLKGNKTGDVRAQATQTSSSDLTSRDFMTDAHFANLLAAIRTGEKLHSPVAEGNVAVTMLQLSNVAWEVNRVLTLDPADGKIVNDADAMRRWDRSYEKGWEPTL